MRHVPDGVLRRLDDEPLAVPDRVIGHVAACERCSTRRAQIAADTERVARLFTAPRLAPDTDLAWARFEREWQHQPAGGPAPPRDVAPVPRRRLRRPAVSWPAGIVMAAVAVVIGGTAAAASFTTIFAPTHVVPVVIGGGDLGGLRDLLGMADTSSLAGFPTATGSTTVRFGAINWSSAPSHPVASLGQASTEAGFTVTLPARRPSGVGRLQQLTVQPRLSATVAFDSAAGSLAGSSVTLHAGPAVLATYSSVSGGNVPTLGVVTMPRPTATSTGASLSQLEAFLLARPGIPPALAEEVRLLGDLKTILPVPVPAGASVRSVQIDGWPGVLLGDASGAVSGVVWEDGHGMLRAVAGLLDAHDVIDVADQLG